jgi:Transcription factor WhiB
MERAACRGWPLNHFFDTYIRDKEVYEQVNQLCGSCPVRKVCLNYGKATKAYGVWGGKWFMNGVIIETLVGMEEEDD